MRNSGIHANRRGGIAIAIAIAVRFLALLFVRDAALTCGAADTPGVSYRNEVMAVLSKAGCNAGTCHGNKNGKGAFKLSLRGQDPDLDFLAITHDSLSRRVDPFQAEQSLLLQKPAGQIAHEGGSRFQKGSEEYEILRRWIAGGLQNDLLTAPALLGIEVTPSTTVLVHPVDRVQLRVRARFSNSTTFDVTSLAVYEPAGSVVTVSREGLVQRQQPALPAEAVVVVRYLQCREPVRVAFVPDRPAQGLSSAETGNYVDRHVFEKLRTLRIDPSKLCSDAVFVRRAYLDLLGILPSSEEARSFVNAPAGARKTVSNRSRLVEELLQRPEFADFWALKWADLLRVEGHSLDAKGVQSFHQWIREGIATNKPLDQFVRELITARGSTYTSPPANYYRPNRDPATRAKAAAQIFLGARLQCAECHNHPSDFWTQDDYYDWAAVFARINYKVIENKREIGSDQHEWKGEQIVFLARKGSVKNPRTGGEAHPRFLGETVARQAESEDGPDELEALAQWLTTDTNLWFARVQANRIWRHLMGRGLVDPPDDFRLTNPASHPALLDDLAKDFVAHKYDMRYLIRLIMNSRAYQLDSEPSETNQDDQSNYSHALVRRVGAEQLLDCQSQVIGTPLKFAGFPAGFRAAQLPGVRPESKGKRRSNQLDQFLDLFGKPPRLVTTDTERSCECNLGQAFQLISGVTLNDMLAGQENRVGRLLAAGKSDSEILQELYWTALTRAPSSEELNEFLPLLHAAKNKRQEFDDILWALVNSKEFLFRK